MKKFLLLLLIITGLSYGKLGQALSFDGTDDYISFSTGVLSGSVTNGTVSAWGKYSSLESNPNQNSVVGFNSEACGAGGDQAVLGRLPNNGFTGNGFGRYNSGWKFANTGVEPDLNSWYFIVGTWGSGGVKFYENGALKGTNADTSAMLGGGCIMVSSERNTGYVNGLIDDVRIYNRALSAAEVRQVYYGIPTTQYGLVGHWQLLGTSNNFAPDISGKKNHGTLTNGPVRGALSKSLKFRR